ncbi:MAG: T9SS C-terminal target domain-containing protein, partial [Bacteroidetes bacterium]
MNRSLIIIFLFTPFMLTAQTFSFDPGGEIVDQVNFDEYSVHQIDILNETSDTLQLSWKLVEKTFPEGWEVTLCDNVACYGSLPNSNDFYPIFDDNYGFIKLTVNPFQVAGTMEFVFLIFPTGNQNDYEEMRFSLTAGGTTSTTAPGSESINLWPNPASEVLYIKNNDNSTFRVNLTNVTGQTLQSFHIQPQRQKEIPVEHLGNGMYFLKYFADEKFL